MRLICGYAMRFNAVSLRDKPWRFLYDISWGFLLLDRSVYSADNKLSIGCSIAIRHIIIVNYIHARCLLREQFKLAALVCINSCISYTYSVYLLFSFSCVMLRPSAVSVQSISVLNELCRPSCNSITRHWIVIIFGKNVYRKWESERLYNFPPRLGGSVAEWLACWTEAQKGLGSNRSRDAVA